MVKIFTDFHLINDCWCIIMTIWLSFFLDDFEGVELTIFSTSDQIHLTKPANGQAVIYLIIEDVIFILFGHETL